MRGLLLLDHHSSDELRRRSGMKDIVCEIKGNMFRWAGHVDIITREQVDEQNGVTVYKETGYV